MVNFCFQSRKQPCLLICCSRACQHSVRLMVGCSNGGRYCIDCCMWARWLRARGFLFRTHKKNPAIRTLIKKSEDPWVCILAYRLSKTFSGNDRKFYFPKTRGKFILLLEVVSVCVWLRDVSCHWRNLNALFMTDINDRHWPNPDILCLLYWCCLEQSAGNLDSSATHAHCGFLVNPELQHGTPHKWEYKCFCCGTAVIFQTQVTLNIENLALCLFRPATRHVCSICLVWILPCRSPHLRSQSTYIYCAAGEQGMTLYLMVSAKKFSHSACKCCFLLVFVYFIYLGLGKLFASEGSADQVDWVSRISSDYHCRAAFLQSTQCRLQPVPSSQTVTVFRRQSIASDHDPLSV